MSQELRLQVQLCHITAVCHFFFFFFFVIIWYRFPMKKTHKQKKQMWLRDPTNPPFYRSAAVHCHWKNGRWGNLRRDSSFPEKRGSDSDERKRVNSEGAQLWSKVRTCSRSVRSDSKYVCIDLWMRVIWKPKRAGAWVGLLKCFRTAHFVCQNTGRKEQFCDVFDMIYRMTNSGKAQMGEAWLLRH